MLIWCFSGLSVWIDVHAAFWLVGLVISGGVCLRLVGGLLAY